MFETDLTLFWFETGGERREKGTRLQLLVMLPSKVDKIETLSES